MIEGGKEAIVMVKYRKEALVNFGKTPLRKEALVNFEKNVGSERSTGNL